jgi:hypothetical protein
MLNSTYLVIFRIIDQVEHSHSVRYEHIQYVDIKVHNYGIYYVMNLKILVLRNPSRPCLASRKASAEKWSLNKIINHNLRNPSNKLF